MELRSAWERGRLACCERVQRRSLAWCLRAQAKQTTVVRESAEEKAIPSQRMRVELIR